MKESDMYEPIQKLLTEQGFTVRGEVKDCDIAAVRENVLWIVEMKLSANLRLIYQAMKRRASTDWVFIAVPRPRRARDSNFSMLKKLVEKLELGLITVALDSPVKNAEILIFPGGRANKVNKKASAIRKEVSGRTVDSKGGTNKTAINTAYRERCVRIACLIEAEGAASARRLVELGCEKDASNILRSNFLGWFTKAGKGIYEISDAGRAYLKENEASSLVVYYRMKAESNSG